MRAGVQSACNGARDCARVWVGARLAFMRVGAIARPACSGVWACNGVQACAGRVRARVSVQACAGRTARGALGAHAWAKGCHGRNGAEQSV